MVGSCERIVAAHDLHFVAPLPLSADGTYAFGVSGRNQKRYRNGKKFSRAQGHIFITPAGSGEAGNCCAEQYWANSIGGHPPMARQKVIHYHWHVKRVRPGTGATLGGAPPNPPR